MNDEFTQKVINAITAIPKGKVSTYGEIAKQAGNPLGAQEVAEILHTRSEKHNLPWQRVINSQGKIAFSNPELASKQRRLLEEEGIVFRDGKVDLTLYLFNSKQSQLDGFFAKK